MKRSRLLAYLMLLVVILGSFGTVSANSAMGNQGESSDKTPTMRADYELVRKAAAIHVADAAKLPGSAWADTIVRLAKGVQLYDDSGEITAFLFNVSVENRDAGYIVVGTEIDEFPVLEFAFEGVPFTEQSFVSAKQKASKSAVDSRIIYYGPRGFAIDAEHSDGSSTTIDLQDGTALSKKAKGNRPRPAHPEEARRFWKFIQVTEIGTMSTAEQNSPKVAKQNSPPPGTYLAGITSREGARMPALRFSRSR
ncbi:MAG TPA: hypothetical protein VK191_16400 [Symbiobacteriaceae bacterium]|nr:hypothetical protein [Symbiobacteriaceae bacterium]